MKAAQYIVVGKYSHEQNSWVPDGDIRHVVSSHRTERAAWISADKAHFGLGGFDGSNRLADVLRRRYRLHERGKADLYVNTYEHAGWIYVPCDFWAAYEIVEIPGGLGFRLPPTI